MARPDRRSAEAAQYRKLYNTKRWRETRADHLAVEPLCRMCTVAGLLNDGGRRMDGSPQPDRRRIFLVCDHIEPHRGDVVKFYAGPFQTLCPDHHDIVKQQIEVRGYIAGSDLAGRPIDPAHPWNRTP